MTHHDVTVFLFSTAILLAVARIFGEIAQRFQQPVILGEILAGLVLGPTLLGAFFPEFKEMLFPPTGPAHVGLKALTTLAITMFLLVAGLEVDLSAVAKNRKAAIAVGVAGLVAPFALGLAPAYFFPEALGATQESGGIVFALFFATAMAITALPVIAKILMDLNLFRTDIGITIIAAAILNDLAGWIVFALVLALMGGEGTTAQQVVLLIVMTVGFAALMLTAGRWLIHKSLPWLLAHTSWPGGILGFSMSLAFLCAAFTEWIGIHAVFGAFLFGIALGDSSHLRQRARRVVEQFVTFVFAPLFFASIGLYVNFVENFDLGLVLIVLALATTGKVLGCTFAARKMGFPMRDARAIGFGMNAHGAMEIILGTLAREAGIITDRLFVALVAMALITTMSSAWLLQRSFGRRKSIQLGGFMSSKTFVPNLDDIDRDPVIRELASLAAAAADVDANVATNAVMRREQIVSSAIGNGIAVPHTQLPGLKRPAIAVGLSRNGLDFDSPDGQPVHVVILLLTPIENTALHLDIMAAIGRFFRDPRVTRNIMTRVNTYTEFLALLNIEAPRPEEPAAV